jgi:hypothetical protein
MKKFLIAGAIALAAALRRFFGGRREQAAGASGS